MKFFVIFACLLSCAICRPALQTVAVRQDTAGNYKFDITEEGKQHTEQRNADGTVSGSYSYVDANGVVQMIQYTAGPDGFRVTGNNLPQAPIDHNLPVSETEDVVKARALHMAAFQQGLPTNA